MSIGFVETVTEQGKSRGIREVDTRNLKNRFLAKKWSYFQRTKGCIWFSPNLIISDAEQKKNPSLSTCGLPRQQKVNVH